MNLEGDINEIQLTERLVDLWREQFTGAIRFESDGIIKIIYFKGGDVLSASTNDRADSIDEILMRAGKVSREHVKQALAKRKENETLGDALLNLGFITRKELTWARRVQVVGVIRSIAAWQTGSFTIVSDYLPKRDEGTLFPLPQILVELVVTEADRQRFERAMDGGAAVFVKSAEFDDVFRRLGLNEEADSIVTQIDGTSSAAEVALASGKDTFNVYKLLDALAMLRILQRTEKPQVTSEFSLDGGDAFASAGVADAADMWNDDAPAMEIGGSSPDFQLDETEAFAAPTLEVPALSMPPESDYQPKPYQPLEAPAVPAATDAPQWSAEPEGLAWDETPPDEPAVPEPAAKMPAWDTPPRMPDAVPIPAPIEPAAEAHEEQWGFDDAQIEAVRRAEAPAPIPIPPAAAAAPLRGKSHQPRDGGGRFGLLLALMVIAILAGAGYFGFLWWQQREEAQIAAQQAVPAAPRPRPAAPVPTATILETPVSDTATTATITTAAPPAGLTVTTAPETTSAPPVTASVAPAPVIPAPAPRPGPPATTTAAEANDPLRARYDAMARDFAAAPSGNYTVQFAIFCQPGSVSNAMKAGGGKVWFVKYSSRCYQAYYGNFETRDEAVAAMSNLPRSLQDSNAKVVGIAR